MTWAMPANQDLIPQPEPEKRIRWAVVVIVSLIALAGMAVLVDMVLR